MSSFLRVAAVLALVCGAARADQIERRDGSVVEGTVVSVDEGAVLLETESGTVRLAREDVATIRFVKPLPPLRVEIRNVHSDDSVDVFLDQEPVLVDARGPGAWTDLTPLLKNGNNPLRLRVRNERGTWAYRLSLRVNGRLTTIACGTALRTDDPCTIDGHSGRELGVIEDIPVIWIHVDRELGRVEVLP